MRSRVIAQSGGFCPARLDPPEFCGLCYSNMKGRSNYKGHSGFRARPVCTKLPERIRWMKRPTVLKPAKGKWACGDAKFATRFPGVAAMLCDPWWDDGTSRQCSSLSVRMDSTSVFLSISDHASSASAYTTAETLEAALELMEAAIQEGTIQWRSWKSGSRK
jgi:hypothetical protein